MTGDEYLPPKCFWCGRRYGSYCGTGCTLPIPIYTRTPYRRAPWYRPLKNSWPKRPSTPEKIDELAFVRQCPPIVRVTSRQPMRVLLVGAVRPRRSRRRRLRPWER
jgi:hypothetical protein